MTHTVRSIALAVGLVGLALTAGCSGPAQEPGKRRTAPAVATVSEPPPAPAARYALGQAATVVLDGGDTTGTVGVDGLRVYRKPTGEYGERPEHGRFVQVTVTVRAGRGRFPVNPYDFYLTDPAGNRYGYGEGTVFSELEDGVLDPADLNPGERLRGRLVFDASADALTLGYTPGVGRTVALWKLG